MVVVGEHLHRQIRRPTGISARLDFGLAVLRDESDIRRPHRVGIRFDLEARLRRVHTAEVVGFGVSGDAIGNPICHGSMAGAGRISDDKPAANQLGALVGHVESQQLLSGHEGGFTHSRNIDSPRFHGAHSEDRPAAE
jgi:hypothetical protein